MAFLTENKALLFGGNTLGDSTNPDAHDFSDDTWIFTAMDTSFYSFKCTWKKLKLNIKPEKRRFHRMANIGDGKVLLYGGSAGGDITAAGKTWLFEYEATDVDERNNNTDVEMRIYRASQNSYLCCLKNPGMDNLRIDLYDLRGNLVKQIYNGIPQANSLKVRIDTESLCGGVYLIRAYSENYSIVQKFVLIE